MQISVVVPRAAAFDFQRADLQDNLRLPGLPGPELRAASAGLSDQLEEEAAGDYEDDEPSRPGAVAGAGSDAGGAELGLADEPVPHDVPPRGQRGTFATAATAASPPVVAPSRASADAVLVEFVRHLRYLVQQQEAVMPELESLRSQKGYVSDMFCVMGDAAPGYLVLYNDYISFLPVSFHRDLENRLPLLMPMEDVERVEVVSPATGSVGAEAARAGSLEFIVRDHRAERNVLRFWGFEDVGAVMSALEALQESRRVDSASDAGLSVMAMPDVSPYGSDEEALEHQDDPPPHVNMYRWVPPQPTPRPRAHQRRQRGAARGTARRAHQNQRLAALARGGGASRRSRVELCALGPPADIPHGRAGGGPAQRGAPLFCALC